MVQSNHSLPNTNGAAFRANNNTAHQAHATWNSGDTAPNTTYPYQVWIDTANGLLKRRNALNTAWITEAKIDGSNPSRYDASQTDYTPGYNGASTVNLRDELDLRGLIPQNFGAAGDGSTDDTTAFSDLETAITGREIDLRGKTYVVSAIPTANTYVNGFWLLSNTAYPAHRTAASISADRDTGAVESNSSLSTVNEPVSGQSTDDQCLVLSGRNSRAYGIRTLVGASFDAKAWANIAAVLASRDTSVTHNTSFAAACEDSYGIAEQTAMIGSLRAQGEGKYGAILASQDSVTATTSSGGGRQAVIACQATHVGGGFGARFTVTLDSSGTITDVTVDDGGQDYANTDTLLVEDIITSGSGADLSPTISGGGITGVTINDGGSGYSEVGLRLTVVTDGGSYNAAIAHTGNAFNRGGTSILAGGRQGLISRGAARSGVYAVDDGEVGSNGDGSAAIGGSQPVVNGPQSVTVGGIQNTTTHTAAVVLGGRRTRSDGNYTITAGDNSSGSASTANRRWQVNAANGNVAAAGSFSGSTTFTDYAEYFENETHGEIPLGTIVALNRDKVRPAQAGDEILGVVSATAIVAAGDSPFSWQGRYVYDEWGRAQTQEIDAVSWRRIKDRRGNVEREGYSGALSDAPEPPDDAEYYTETVYVENPDYDPEREQTPRSERPAEWTCVGMLGQVRTRVSQDVQPNDYVTETGDKANSPTRLRCMRTITPYDPDRGFAVAMCLLR